LDVSYRLHYLPGYWNEVAGQMGLMAMERGRGVPAGGGARRPIEASSPTLDYVVRAQRRAADAIRLTAALLLWMAACGGAIPTNSPRREFLQQEAGELRTRARFFVFEIDIDVAALGGFRANSARPFRDVFRRVPLVTEAEIGVVGSHPYRSRRL